MIKLGLLNLATRARAKPSNNGNLVYSLHENGDASRIM